MLNTDKEFAELKSVLHNLGIIEGDILYVASDITRLMYHATHQYKIETLEEYEKYMSDLVNTLQDVVGAKGTLLLPVFTWEFCRGNAFSIKTSKGSTGALNNWVLKKRTDFQRTQHPIYSFMVWGKDSDLLVAMQNKDSWAEDSPFGYCRKNHAKMLMIDVVPGKCSTFLHYVEEYLKVPWRYMKDFAADYTDVNGHTSRRKYSMFVRDLDIESKLILDTAVFNGKNVLEHDKWAEIDLWFMEFSKAFPFYMDDLRNNNAKSCYHFENYTPDWSREQTHPDFIIA